MNPYKRTYFWLENKKELDVIFTKILLPSVFAFFGHQNNDTNKSDIQSPTLC